MVKEVSMSASAEIRTTTSPRPASQQAAPRVDLPTCPVCADSMVAAESSAFLADNEVSYLWTCDTCGYGFVTKHVMRKISCS
jgi:hypothetical protein